MTLLPVILTKVAVTAGDDLATGHHGPGGVLGASPVVVFLGLPVKFAIVGTYCSYITIGCTEVELVLVKAHNAGPCGTTHVATYVIRYGTAVLPNQVSVGGINRLDNNGFILIGGMNDIHHTLMHQRNDLLSSRGHSPRPFHLQLVNIVAVNLVEWTETMVIIGPAVQQPISRIRI